MNLDCVARKKFKMKFEIPSFILSALGKDGKGLIFFEIWNIRILTEPRRNSCP